MRTRSGSPTWQRRSLTKYSLALLSTPSKAFSVRLTAQLLQRRSRTRAWSRHLLVSRLFWGIGCWNQHTAACFALATSQKYGCPPVHERIALDQPARTLVAERHVTAWRDSAQGSVASHPVASKPVASQEVNKVTYKTPDYMLTSAQDYYPGEAGGGEHLWQATWVRAQWSSSTIPPV